MARMVSFASKKINLSKKLTAKAATAQRQKSIHANSLSARCQQRDTAQSQIGLRSLWA
jgi:hypothetical protein